MKIRHASLAAASILLVLSADAAHAARVEFEFDAVVTRDWYPGVASFLASAGDTFTGRFSYDSEAPPGIRNDYNLLFYPQDVEQFGVEISLGLPDSFNSPVYVRSNGYKVAVSDGSAHLTAGMDIFKVGVSSEGFAPGEWPPGPLIVFQILLRDSSGSVFSSDALPATLDLEDFEMRQLRLRNGVLGTDEPEWIIDSEITRLQLVPEPTSATLVAVGLALLGAAGRRRRLCRLIAC